MVNFSRRSFRIFLLLFLHLSQTDCSTKEPKLFFSCASEASSKLPIVCWPWKHVCAKTEAPIISSMCSCVFFESNFVSSIPSTTKDNFDNLVRVTALSITNGFFPSSPSRSSIKDPRTITRADFESSLTTSLLVKYFCVEPVSKRTSDLPVNAHMTAVTNVVLPAPLESANPESSRLSPTTHTTPRSLRGYVISSLNAPNPVISTSSNSILRRCADVESLFESSPVSSLLLSSFSLDDTTSAIISSQNALASPVNWILLAYELNKSTGLNDSAFSIVDFNSAGGRRTSIWHPYFRRAFSTRFGTLRDSDDFFFFVFFFFFSSSSSSSSSSIADKEESKGIVHRTISFALKSPAIVSMLSPIVSSISKYLGPMSIFERFKTSASVKLSSRHLSFKNNRYFSWFFSARDIWYGLPTYRTRESLSTKCGLW